MDSVVLIFVIYYMNYIDYCEQWELHLLNEKRPEKKVKDLNYWRTRCELAEHFIDEASEEYDIYDESYVSYQNWTTFKTEL